VFSRMHKPKDYSMLGEEADHDDAVDAPEPGTAVTAEMRRMLDFTEPWTTCPDYQRVRGVDGSPRWLLGGPSLHAASRMLGPTPTTCMRPIHVAHPCRWP
jgi:hypothetical protein